MTSRRAEKEKRRQERLEWEREQAEQAKRRRMYSIVAGGILVVAAAAAIIVAVVAGGGGGGSASADSLGGKKLTAAATNPPGQQTTDLFQIAKTARCKLTNPAIEGRTHLDPNAPIPNYKTNPPSSGNHDPVPATDGAYAVAPGVKHTVHALEHGRVEVQWRGITDKQISQLKGLFDEDPYHMLYFPNQTKMHGQLAVVAWGHIALCKKMTDDDFDLIRAFTTRYRDKGPEFVP
jgi:Protein of unknown function (DUF3105)